MSAPRAPSFDAIAVGDTYAFDCVLTEEDAQRFAEVSGDTTTLRADELDHGATHGHRRIVHGMHAAALFSTLIDVYGTGPKSVHVRQTLEFRRPIVVGDHVTVRGTVIGKRESARMVTLSTEVRRGSDVMVSGEALIKVLP